MTKLYIGSNNISHICEVEKVEQVLNKYFDGYTIVNSQGYWRGNKEDSIIVSISNGVGNNIIEELKEVLQQESIMVEVISSIISFK